MLMQGDEDLYAAFCDIVDSLDESCAEPLPPRQIPRTDYSTALLPTIQTDAQTEREAAQLAATLYMQACRSQKFQPEVRRSEDGALRAEFIHPVPEVVKELGVDISGTLSRVWDMVIAADRKSLCSPPGTTPMFRLAGGVTAWGHKHVWEMFRATNFVYDFRNGEPEEPPCSTVPRDEVAPQSASTLHGVAYGLLKKFDEVVFLLSSIERRAEELHQFWLDARSQFCCVSNAHYGQPWPLYANSFLDFYCNPAAVPEWPHRWRDRALKDETAGLLRMQRQVAALEEDIRQTFNIIMAKRSTFVALGPDGILQTDLADRVLRLLSSHTCCQLVQTCKFYRDFDLVAERVLHPRIRNSVAIADARGRNVGPFPHARYPQANGKLVAYVVRNYVVRLFVDVVRRMHLYGGDDDDLEIKLHDEDQASTMEEEDSCPVRPTNTRGNRSHNFDDEGPREKRLPTHWYERAQTTPKFRPFFTVRLVYADSKADVVGRDGKNDLVPSSNHDCRNYLRPAAECSLPAQGQFKIRCLSRERGNRMFCIAVKMEVPVDCQSEAPKTKTCFSEPFYCVGRLYWYLPKSERKAISDEKAATASASASAPPLSEARTQSGL